jgi:hypothetical protein
MEIITASLALTAGIGIAAGLNHLSAGIRRKSDQVHLFFSLVCFITAGLAISDIFWYKAVTIPNLILTGKVTMTFLILLDVAILWFATRYTGVTLKIPRNIFTALFFLLLLYNGFSEYGIQYHSITSVEAASMPWGEIIGESESVFSTWLIPSYVMTFLMGACVIGCCIRQYKVGGKRPALILVIGIVFHIGANVWDLYIDILEKDFFYLTEYSWIPMMLLMSTELSSKQWNAELQQALGQVKKLSGLLPICSSCKKVRDDEGYWRQIDSYIRDHSEAHFSHGFCPDCARKYFENFYSEVEKVQFAFDGNRDDRTESGGMT